MRKLVLRSSFPALGTQIDAWIVFENKRQAKEAQRDIKKVKDIFSAKQKIFCRFNPESELSKLNRSLGVWQKASPDIVYLAKRALFYHRESGGLYDPRVVDILENMGYKSDRSTTAKPEYKLDRFKKLSASLKIKEGRILFASRMDFSGIAKGYIIDQAASFLKRRDWKNFFINAGGDAYASGLDEEGKKWRFPIEGARDKRICVYISNQAVATSGVTKRRWRHKGKNVHHLINPKNPGQFSFELRSVLVFHKKVEWADGRAKILVLMGKEKGPVFAKKKKLNALFVDKRGRIYCSSHADKHF